MRHRNFWRRLGRDLAIVVLARLIAAGILAFVAAACTALTR